MFFNFLVYAAKIRFFSDKLRAAAHFSFERGHFQKRLRSFFKTTAVVLRNHCGRFRTGAGAVLLNLAKNVHAEANSCALFGDFFANFAACNRVYAGIAPDKIIFSTQKALAFAGKNV